MSNARNLANLLGTGTTIASAKIADDAITNAKISNDAVTGAKIEDSPTIAGNLAVAGTTSFTGKVTATGDVEGFGVDDRVLLNATDGSGTDDGDFLVLNSTDGSANDGENILFDTATSDGSAVLSSPAIVLTQQSQLTTPTRPFIFMDLGANESVNLSTHSNVGQIPFSRVLDSFAITLDTTTHAFKIPITGLYLMCGGLRFNNGSSYLWWRVHQVPGSGTGGQSTAFPSGSPSQLILANSNSGGFTTNVSPEILMLTAGQEYECHFGDGGGTTADVHAAQSYMKIVYLG